MPLTLKVCAILCTTRCAVLSKSVRWLTKVSELKAFVFTQPEQRLRRGADWGDISKAVLTDGPPSSSMGISESARIPALPSLSSALAGAN